MFSRLWCIIWRTHDYKRTTLPSLGVQATYEAWVCKHCDHTVEIREDDLMWS